ncbi:hypothetical protein [Actinospongicola halichondriae]|uniref:hypothetical protein n=1 Tax=Actinospongicola halichondriae TaxID=3236844 RepID=UPI003D52E5B6
MKIKAMSVFEGIVYHSVCLDPSHPERPTLEVEAVLRDGDVDDGPVLLPWADFVYMVGTDVARRCFADFADDDRIVDHLGVKHLAFPLWTAGDITRR